MRRPLHRAEKQRGTQQGEPQIGKNSACLSSLPQLTAMHQQIDYREKQPGCNAVRAERTEQKAQQNKSGVSAAPPDAAVPLMIPENHHGQHHHGGEWNILPHRDGKNRIEGKCEEKEPQHAKCPARRSVAAEQAQHSHIRCREQRHRDKRIKCHAIIHESRITGNTIGSIACLGCGSRPIQRGLI